ncbi:MAG: hypothetical protein F6J98_33915 [Moorea sp. SIO4G2]|uniref:hypothetical protein n=1 Tax=Moorena TaxID=1155738 RepID=UPI001300CE56|nr:MULTISPECIES: hypothetical protein [Moorena]NEO24782.1 hypothetical protein [Moorena sp. SIO4A5]NEO65124.1 hypothetical protein [Moorena sp. SIO4G2]NEP27515.1 hypothetical protein [Moorena sp. SIO3I6]
MSLGLILLTSYIQFYSPDSDSRLPTPDSRLPTPDSRLPTLDSRLPTSKLGNLLFRSP